jgi:hypothetical protein
MTDNPDADPTSPDDGPGISDDQLPEDLRPTDDNPLAKDPGEESDTAHGGTSPEDAEIAPPAPDGGQPAPGS